MQKNAYISEKSHNQMHCTGGYCSQKCVYQAKLHRKMCVLEEIVTKMLVDFHVDLLTEDQETKGNKGTLTDLFILLHIRPPSIPICPFAFSPFPLLSVSNCSFSDLLLLFFSQVQLQVEVCVSPQRDLCISPIKKTLISYSASLVFLCQVPDPGQLLL